MPTSSQADKPRLILMAMMGEPTRQLLLEALTGIGVPERLGRTMFPPSCWHQSLSDSFYEDKFPGVESVLREVGRLVHAEPFTMLLDRVESSPRRERFDWSVRAARMPPELSALHQSIRHLLRQLGGIDDHRHTPHVTVSYFAPAPIERTPIAPVLWTVREFTLVRGHGKPYRYDVLARWPLLRKPAPPPGLQLDLL